MSLRRVTLFALVCAAGGFLPAPLGTEPAAPEGGFPSTNLIHTPTAKVLEAKTLEFLIFHRFGSARSGVEDFFGLDSGANVQLALDFALTNRLAFGLSRTSDLKTYEARTKFSVIRRNSWALSLFGAAGQETTDQVEYRGPLIADPARVPQTGLPLVDAEINELNRLPHELSPREKQSYLGAVLLSRTWGPVTLQFSPMFVHRNHVPYGLLKDRWGIAFGGRLRITERLGILFETIGTPQRDYQGDDYRTLDGRSYGDQQNFTADQVNSTLGTNPSALTGILLRNVVFDRPVPYYYVPASLALDIDTGGHIFQIVFSNSRRLAATQILRGADFDYNRRDYVIGFNISRLFWFGGGE